MSQTDEDFESYGIEDRCIVPWTDGSMYCGRIQKILDPVRECLIEGVPHRKDGKQQMLENTVPFAKVRKERSKRVPPEILRESQDSGQRWFFVHYFGWGPTFDEWLPLKRMLPYNPRNISDMKAVNAELKEKAKRAKEKEAQEAKARKMRKKQQPDDEESLDFEPSKPRKRTPREPSSNFPEMSSASGNRGHSAGGVGTPKRRRVVIDDGPGFEIRLSLPLDFKRLLVEDWKLVTHDRAIVNLPRPISVVEILKDFVEHSLRSASSGDRENMDQFVRSMITYFDFSLGMMLLYRFERNAYYYQRKGDAHFKPSLIYGAEHLARLMVNMPSLLSQLSQTDDITLEYIVRSLEALAVFMTEHKARYFRGSSSYVMATRAYEITAIPNATAESFIPENVNSGN